LPLTHRGRPAATLADVMPLIQISETRPVGALPLRLRRDTKQQSEHATSDVDVGDAEDHDPTVRLIIANPVNVARRPGERYSQLILVA